MTSVWLLWEMESHAPSCAAVGCGKAPLNHVRVGSENRPRMVSASGVCGATRCYFIPLLSLVFAGADEVVHERNHHHERYRGSSEDTPAEAFARAERGDQYADDAKEERGQEQQGEDVAVRKERGNVHAEARDHQADGHADVGVAPPFACFHVARRCGVRGRCVSGCGVHRREIVLVHGFNLGGSGGCWVQLLVERTQHSDAHAPRDDEASEGSCNETPSKCLVFPVADHNDADDDEN